MTLTPTVTTLGTIDGCDMLFENLANQSTYHILTKDINTHDNDHFLAYTIGVENKYMQKELYGIMIDTVSNWLTRGYEQYMAYNKCSSVGTITINPPPTGRTMFNFHVVDADTPFLLCLRDIGIYLDSHPMHGKSPSRFLYENMDFNHNKGLEFVLLDFASSNDKSQIIVFIQSSFAHNKDYSSQIGFMIVLANEDIDKGRCSKETLKGLINTNGLQVGVDGWVEGENDSVKRRAVGMDYSDWG
jgi:hypothetical protein